MNHSPSALKSDVTIPQVIFWPRQPGRRTIYKLILADWAVRQFKEKYHLSFSRTPVSCSSSAARLANCAFT